MTRFEISGTIVGIIANEVFYVQTDGGVLRVPLRPDQDRPKVGDKATVAVEVYS